MNITIELTGTTPLLMHNPRLADPQDPIAREMKMITAKRKKTDEDHEQLARLEWHGGLYTTEIDGRPVVSQPTAKVRKCLINAAKISKLGKSVERAVTLLQLDAPLGYEGPDSIDQISADQAFHSRLPVKVGTSRVMRVRPKFFPWSLAVDAMFFEDAGLNFHELLAIVEKAGIVEGIGDNRVNGYGRFVGKVVKA